MPRDPDPFTPPSEREDAPPPRYDDIPDVDDDDAPPALGPIHSMGTLLAFGLICSPMAAVALQVLNWIRVGSVGRAVALVVAAVFGLFALGIAFEYAGVGTAALVGLLALVQFCLDYLSLRRKHPHVGTNASIGEAVVVGLTTASLMSMLAQNVPNGP